MEGGIQGVLLEKDGSYGKSQGISMDLLLGSRRRVKDVKDRGFAELGLQGCEGVLLGGSP